MYRWHESKCRRPDVVVAGSTPYCNYCSALAPANPLPTNTAEAIPQVRNAISLNHSWLSGLSSISSETNATQSTCCDSLHEDKPVKKPKKQSDENARVLNRSPTAPLLVSIDEFRLLRLEPGAPDGLIHAQLEVTDLRNSQKPVYDALSYSWAGESGDRRRSCPVFIGPYWDIIYTTHNCHEALKAIRAPRNHRLIWVDSICIMHSNTVEKSHQTSLVPEIYAKAAKVIIYLGHSSEDSDDALDFMKGATASSLDDLTRACPQQQTALTSLFQRIIFSRLWTVPETLYAQELEVVCGRRSLRWSNTSSGLNLSNVHAPSWFYDSKLWRNCGNQHPLMHVIIQTRGYECSDPRDKVFAILGLFDKSLSPNYELSVESVYTGFAAYLLKTLSLFEMLMLVNEDSKTFDLPSWVPDWSQKLHYLVPEKLSVSEEDDSPLGEEGFTAITPLIFETGSEDTQLIFLAGDDNRTLQLQASEVCKVEGEIIRHGNQTRILMDRKELGVVIVSLSAQHYEIGADYIFRLASWETPVILRGGSSFDSFSFVTACAMSYAPPLVSGTWLIPWGSQSMGPNWPEDISISNFVPQDLSAFTESYARLQEILGNSHRSASVDSMVGESAQQKAKVLDIIRLLQTGLGTYERHVRDLWKDLERKLRWMFLDKGAIRQFVDSLDNTNQEDQSGETSMDLDKWEEVSIKKFFGVNPPTTCNWNLRRFCYSFLQLSLSNRTPYEDQKTPIFHKLCENFADIKRWAEVTEQLMASFQFTKEVLRRSWSSFPGSSLPEKWTHHWQASGDANASWSSKDERCIAGLSCQWSWSEFQEVLELREQIWGLETPRQLDPLVNQRVATHIGARTLGLDTLYQKTIRIQ